MTPVVELMVAIPGLNAVHVPPDGVPVAVVPLPTQTVDCAKLTVGLGKTVNGVVGAEEHPVDVCVQVKVAVPAAIPVTTPALVTVATAGFEDCQVPPVAGVTVVVERTHIELVVNVTVGVGVTVTFNVSDLHPVDVSVKTKRPVPGVTPVTTPPFVTVAMAGNTAVHVPPVVGINVVVEPIHTAWVPLMATDGGGLTVTADVVLVQPVVASVNVKVAVPCPTAVTTPLADTVATLVLLLTQVPPVVGDNVVLAPIQILFAPVILTVGRGFTVNCMVSAQVGVA